jgi:hypothetical protein
MQISYYHLTMIWYWSRALAIWYKYNDTHIHEFSMRSFRSCMHWTVLWLHLCNRTGQWSRCSMFDQSWPWDVTIWAWLSKLLNFLKKLCGLGCVPLFHWVLNGCPQVFCLDKFWWAVRKITVTFWHIYRTPDVPYVYYPTALMIFFIWSASTVCRIFPH